MDKFIDIYAIIHLNGFFFVEKVIFEFVACKFIAIDDNTDAKSLWNYWKLHLRTTQLTFYVLDQQCQPLCSTFDESNTIKIKRANFRDQLNHFFYFSYFGLPMLMSLTPDYIHYLDHTLLAWNFPFWLDNSYYIIIFFRWLIKWASLFYAYETNEYFEWFRMLKGQNVLFRISQLLTFRIN